MVASFRAIRAYSKKTGKAFSGKYYTERTYDGDYLARGGEKMGEWCGTGCWYVSLRGGVLAEHFRRIVHQRNPHTGKHLFNRRKPLSKAQEQKRRQHQIACVDITFTPEKSLSAFLVYAPTSVRRRVEKILLESVRETLEGAEATLPLARRGKAGHERLMAKIIAALFLHRANRNGDPGWHVHAAIANAVKTEHGWSSINSKMLRDWTRSLGPVFRSAVTAKLKEELGLELQEVIDQQGNKKGWAKLAGVPDDLCNLWSSRKHQIDQTTGRYKAGADPTAQSRATAAQLTRKKKEPLPPEKEYIAKLRQDGARYGFNEAKAVALLGRSKTVTTEHDYKAAFEKAVSTLAKTRGHFTHAQVVTAVAEDLQSLGMPARELMRRISHDLFHSHGLKLLNPTAGETRHTTKDMWELEEGAEDCAKNLAAQKGPQLSKHAIERHLATRKDLSPEQANACRYLLGPGGSLKILTGIAGAGKSRTLDCIRKLLEANGKRVVGAAVAGAAKEELAQKAHIESRTVASWLFHLELTPKERANRAMKHHAKQLVRAAKGKRTYPLNQVKLTKDSVLIVDEAGMLGTASGYRLLRQVEKAKASVMLVGDDDQIQSVNAAGLLGHLKKNLHHFHMKENWRQFNTRDQLASGLLRDGKGDKAIKDYFDRKLVHVSDTRIQAMDELVSTLAASGGLTEPKSHVCFTMTRMETKLLNHKIQAARLSAKAIDPERFVTFDNENFHVGDRVMVHQPLHQFGLENGYRGTVLNVDKLRKKVDVRFDQKVKLFGNRPVPNNVVTLPLRQLAPGSLSMSYSMTTHKGQGQTCDYAYLLVGGRMTDKELTYTQITRARRKTRIFVDKLHAGPLLKDLSTSISRSRKKKLAHDMLLETQPASKTPQHTHEPN